MTIKVKAGTCCMACWMAVEDECRCICGGRNHGIMRHGGQQPGRYCQKHGCQYQLEAIVPSWYDARHAATMLIESAPKRTRKHYGAGGKAVIRAYTDDGAAYEQHATGNMLRWPEVQNYLAAGNRDAYLVWRRFSFEA